MPLSAPPTTAISRFTEAVAHTADLLGIRGAEAHHRQGYFWTCYEHAGSLHEVQAQPSSLKALRAFENAFIASSLNP